MTVRDNAAGEGIRSSRRGGPDTRSGDAELSPAIEGDRFGEDELAEPRMSFDFEVKDGREERETE